ncbi:MAG: hypothetical protein WAU23_12750 [Ferruginibacter sp.]
MEKTKQQTDRLILIRNSYGAKAAIEKLKLLHDMEIGKVKNKRSAGDCYSALLFIRAYPDNKTMYRLAGQLLRELQAHIQSNKNLQYQLYNTGITGTKLCAAFSFELVKWMRKTRSNEIKLVGFEADDAKIQSILSVVMSKTESEILQDANAGWKDWLKELKKPDEDLLDQIINIFDSSDIRPEVKEELWNTIGPNVEIHFVSHDHLPESLTRCYYHRALIRKEAKQQPLLKPVPVKLSETEAAQIVDCSRMILVRKLRELDPISFTSPEHVSLYHLPRGISIALTGMVPTHRHPVDSYMGYLVFKNGLPVAYAGSWILFNSARIGLNVFADYRGGEAKYIFNQVLQLHARVYNLKRFTVDPYQIGKDNDDGIHSGAFWIYYQAGFRPLKKVQRELAAAEALKRQAGKKYRSSPAVLKILADSRMELVLKKTAVRIDATDLSVTYAGIIAKKFNGSRKHSIKKLADILQIKNYQEPNMNFILNSWVVLLSGNEEDLRNNGKLKKELKKAFLLKASGSEEAYIAALQKSKSIRKNLEEAFKKYAIADK